MQTGLSFYIQAATATAYLAFKIVVVFAIAKLMRANCSLDRFGSLMAGWLVTQALQNAVILGLSMFGALNRLGFVALTLVLTAPVVWWARRSPAPPEHPALVSLRNPALYAIAGVLILMWLRALFLYDYTWDAQTYGLPRLVLWLNAGSVFLHMPTLQLNLFVNEWNAELNALAFALASGSYLGFAFGNLEVLLWLFVSIAWVAQLLGASAYWAIILSLVLGSTPAVIGLATTIKGDLLAVTAFVMMFGWFIHVWQSRSNVPFAMLLISASLAIGAKISVALPVMALLSIAVATFRIHAIREMLRSASHGKALVLLCLIVFSSRLLTNWVVYGNPLIRIGVERPQFSLSNVISNLDLAFSRFFGMTAEARGDGVMWALSGSMGGAAWFILVAVLVTLLGALWHRFEPDSSGGRRSQQDRTTGTGWVAFAAGAILVATLASMALSASYHWTFRYFAPGIFVLVIVIGAFVLRSGSTGFRRYILLAMAAIAFLISVRIVARPGEVLPTLNRKELRKEIRQASTPLKRMSMFIKGPYREAAVDVLHLDGDTPLNILAYKDLETSLVPFLGSRAQNRIQTVASGEDLIASATRPGWDVVAILQQAQRRDHTLTRQLEERGYSILVDNAQYVIALPSQRISLTPMFQLKELNWSPFISLEGVRAEIRNGIPEVQSTFPVDAGFVTQEFRIKGPTLFRASFEGEIWGSGIHAAHLSLRGAQPIITLPSGRYASSRSFLGILPDAGSESLHSLSFGLGGWSQGGGHLRLTGIEAFHLRVADPSKVAPG